MTQSGRNRINFPFSHALLLRAADSAAFQRVVEDGHHPINKSVQAHRSEKQAWLSYRDFTAAAEVPKAQDVVERIRARTLVLDTARRATLQSSMPLSTARHPYTPQQNAKDDAGS